MREYTTVRETPGMSLQFRHRSRAGNNYLPAVRTCRVSSLVECETDRGLDTVGERVDKWRCVVPLCATSRSRRWGVRECGRTGREFAVVNAAAAPATVCGECLPIATDPMRVGKAVARVDSRARRPATHRLPSRVGNTATDGEFHEGGRNYCGLRRFIRYCSATYDEDAS